MEVKWYQVLAEFDSLQGDPAVSRWLGKYGSRATRKTYLYVFGMFLKWVKAEKWLDTSPSGLIHRNLENVYKGDALDVARKREATDWLLEFIQKNGVVGKAGNSYRRLAGVAVQSFYKRNDSPLFGDFKVPLDNWEEPKTKPLSPEMAKQFISVLPLRAKLAALFELQSGMRICDIVNLKWKQLMDNIGKPAPWKITLRNDIGREYYTFIGKDTINLLEIYLKYRKGLVGHDIQPEEYVLVNDARRDVDTSRPIDPMYVQRQIRLTAFNMRYCEKKNEYFPRYDYHTHTFRKVFKTALAHAGVEPDMSEFLLGHDGGIERIYNERHKVHEDDFIEIYKKVEPYLSITETKQSEADTGRIKELEERLAKLEAVYTKRLNIKTD